MSPFDLTELIEGTGADPPMSVLDQRRMRIFRVIRTFKDRVELDCPGDCYRCPAAQLVRCWILSRETVETFESHLTTEEWEMAEHQLYTRKELEALEQGDLYRIGAVEAKIPRFDVYSMPKEEIILKILEARGAPGEVDKAPEEPKGKKGGPKKKAPPKKKKGGEPAATGEPADAEESAGAPKKATRKQKSAGKKAPPKKKAPPSAPPTAEGTEGGEQPESEAPTPKYDKGDPLHAFEDAEPAALIHAALLKMVAKMGGTAGAAEEVAFLREQVMQLVARVQALEEAERKAVAAIDLLVDKVMAGFVDVQTILENYLDLDDVEGEGPFARLKDVADRYRE